MKIMKKIMYVGIFFAVILLASVTDAQITGWTAPTISSAASGASTNSISVAEDAAVSTSVYTFVAKPTASAKIASYVLLTLNTPFELSSPSGILTVSAALDYETTNSYIIQVKATDDANTAHSGTATVTITVTDVTNEATPTFGKTTYTVCIVDGATADTSVTKFTATDTDAGSSITYIIFSGDTKSYFKVSESELQINTGKTLTMSTTATYTLVIHATDNGSPPKTGSAMYTINVESSCQNGATALTVTFFTMILALIVSLN